MVTLLQLSVGGQGNTSAYFTLDLSTRLHKVDTKYTMSYAAIRIAKKTPRWHDIFCAPGCFEWRRLRCYDPCTADLQDN